MKKLKIGLAQVEYKPKIGLPMMGHFRDDYSSRGFHDPLYSKAIVFADGDSVEFVLVSLDICMITAAQVELLREIIQEDTGVLGSKVFVTATHTHGGPATERIYTSPKAQDQDIEEFLKRAAKSVKVAISNLAEAQIKVGYGYEDRLGFNRRLKCKDGQTHMNWEMLEKDFVLEELGPIDPEVAVVSIEQNGRAVSAMVNHALHTAILDYENFEYTADFPGYLAQAMEKFFDKDFITLFLNGCCGNINHINYADHSSPRRGFEMAQRCGYMLAAEAFKATKNAALCPVDKIAVSSEKVELERLKIDEKMYEKAVDFLKNGQEENAIADGLPMEYAAPVWIEMWKKQNETYNAEVMVARVGALAIVGLPGEMFCEFGLEIKEKSPAAHTIVIELSNDAIGYVPTEVAFDQGGYEVTAGACHFVANAGEKLKDSAIRQINNLFKN